MEGKVAQPASDRKRGFAVAAVAVVLLVPPVVLAVKRATSTAPVRAAGPAAPAASEYSDHMREALRLLDSGQAQESLVLLERARLLEPNSFAVYTNLCMAHAALRQKAKAVAACERAVEIDPDKQLGKNNLKWVQGLEPGAPP
jgi:tetratricopeptide (TPR) repeat protein